MNSLALAFLLATCGTVLSLVAVHGLDLSKYPFRKVLLNDQGQYYALYWNFSIPEATIHIALNVSTTGWVGFGVSPTGHMPGSDVIIGWVAHDGKIFFHVSCTQICILQINDNTSYSAHNHTVGSLC